MRNSIKTVRKQLAIYIIITLLLSMFPQGLDLIMTKTSAAGNLVITTDTITPNSVNLSWPVINNATWYSINYHTTTGQSVSVAVYSANSTITSTINSLSTNFVYDFKVSAFDDSNNSKAAPVTKQVITGISFDAFQIGDVPAVMAGGGYEVGVDPQLQFRIQIPSTYNTGTSTVTSYTYNNLDYDINFSGSNLSRLKLRYNSASAPNQYIVTAYTGGVIKTVAEHVYTGDEESGYMTFYIKGQKANANGAFNNTPYATNAQYPGAETGSGFAGGNISEDFGITHSTVNMQNIYRYTELQPGMVLRASIAPRFSTNGVGYIESSVTGGYTYSPLRFQITKDSSNNLIATIYKVAQAGSNPPTFTYDVRISGQPDFGNSSSIATRSDGDSIGGTLMVYIEKQSDNSTYYYKVIASASGQNQTIESTTIGYSPSQDTSLAPLPEDVRVLSVDTVTGSVKDTFYDIATAGVYSVKSANVKLVWKKPINYDDLINKINTSGTVADMVYYNIQIAASQSGGNGTDMEHITGMFGDVTLNAKNYLIKYRTIYKVEIPACTVTDANGIPTMNGGYLSFTVNGLNQNINDGGLFSVVTGAAPGTITQDLTMNDPSPNQYPTYLLPNKIYFLKVFTVKGNSQSDYSLPVSFTTPVDSRKTPPAPNNFKLLDNSRANDQNSVKLEWDKINFNLSDYTMNTVAFAVYYDLYINNNLNTDEYVKIGSCQQGVDPVNEDVEFSGTRNTSQVVDATVSQLANCGDLRFIDGLKPNSVYYFAVKTRVSIAGDTQDRESLFTQILSLTTVKGPIIPPDNNSFSPRAPVDFTVALDSSGNKLLDSTSVTLRWTKLEAGVKYSLVSSAAKIGSGAEIDGTMTQLLSSVDESQDNMDLVNADGVILSYDAVKKEFSYKVNELSPNSIYYFSLRAEKLDDTSAITSKSVWVTVPVTTSIIELPQLLNVVADNEIGLWLDEESVYTPDSFTVESSLDGSSYTALPRGQVFVSKEAIDPTKCRYYFRVVSLKKNTNYFFRIIGHKIDQSNISHDFSKDIDSSETGTGVHPMLLSTREDKHEIDVKWKGRDGYNFQLAIKGDNDTDYTILNENSDEFIYLSKEKPSDMIGTNYTMYYARIRTVDGTTQLKANTKYYIKVRSLKQNDVLTAAINDGTIVYDFSRYIGPVNTRTEFSQTDYDTDEQTNKEKASYADKVKKFNSSIYWEIGNDSGVFRVKLRKDKVENFIRNDAGRVFTLDFSSNTDTTITQRGVYIPLSTMQLLSSRNENLLIKVPGAEFTLRPGTINLTTVTSDMSGYNTVKETYIYIDITKLSEPSVEFPSNTTKASDLQSLFIEERGMSVIDADIELFIKNQLDNYITSGLATLQGTNTTAKNTSQGLNDTINTIVSNFEGNLKTGIQLYMEGTTDSGTKVIVTNSISTLSKPLNVKMTYASSVKGLKTGYVYADDNWLSQTSYLNTAGNSVSLDTIKTGDYVILAAGLTGLFSIPDGHWAQKDIETFTSKYDIRDIFQNNYSISVDNPITVNDTILVIGKVLSPNGGSSSGSLASTAKNLGLDGTVNFNNNTRSLSRQEMAILLMRVYRIKSGVDPNNMKPTRILTINDDSTITASHYKEVAMSVDMKVMSLDDKKNFRPNEVCSKAQFISAFTRLLKVLGEL